ncbi:hypothetical protein [Chloroflexus sp.]|uniref:hypothetical protein n=1 Tax=Chloroflexus sp. TaxID=1904827 RepID=UPI00404A395E
MTAAGTPVAGIGGSAMVAGNPVQAPFATNRRPNPLAAVQGVGDLLYATFLRGRAWDDGIAIAVDAGGAVYVTDANPSPDFPTTPGTVDTTFDGYSDTFVVKPSPTGATLAYTTFLRGLVGSGALPLR